MLSFENDYNVGAHKKVLNALIKTNMQQETGYGYDSFTASAKEKIKKAIGTKCEVYFLCGGTATNATIISAFLRSYEGVISCDTGHINGHEAGAIEYSGHKVLSVPHVDGKVTAKAVEEYMTSFNNDANNEHVVRPGMVYISHPTEYGTIYSKNELTELSKTCKKYGLPLYLDGARLGYALASKKNDLSLKDIAKLCDVFYIGGTKVGALLGEAVIFTKDNMPKHFLAVVKQRGGLLAKGRVLGVQFDTLFTDDLYFEISKNAIDRAEELKELLRKKGYEFYKETDTNQQFVILEDKKYNELIKKVAISFWEKPDENHTVVRFATSFATTKKDIKELEKLL